MEYETEQMELYSSPSYHYISPLVHSSSNLSSFRSSAPIRRTQSYVQSTHQNRHYTMPRYGYGGGYMSRSLSRNESTLFGRSLQSSVLAKTPPFHSVALQRSTPHYTDKYPYVRYTYGNLDTSLGILAQSDALGRSHSVRDLGTKRWLEGSLSSYNSRLFSTPTNYYERVERPVAPTRNYIRYMPMEDAMNMYKKRCMTVSTLSKYWLTPSTRTTRQDSNIYGSDSYSTSRYARQAPSTYSFASRLTSYW
ncbi:unnamed protein product [Enterobius vermicularis]|uniref:Plakophilin-4 n=1 Tax=Enterobius vermicularis TaxID=51028 RepID=A0A0N4V3Q0_ENTVE|nr:unnamed protein product [Enterobius vermicularis]